MYWKAVLKLNEEGIKWYIYATNLKDQVEKLACNALIFRSSYFPLNYSVLFFMEIFQKTAFSSGTTDLLIEWDLGSLRSTRSTKSTGTILCYKKDLIKYSISKIIITERETTILFHLPESSKIRFVQSSPAKPFFQMKNDTLCCFSLLPANILVTCWQQWKQEERQDFVKSFHLGNITL